MWTKPLAGAGIFHPVEPDAASAPTIGMHGVDVPRPTNFRRHRRDTRRPGGLGGRALGLWDRGEERGRPGTPNGASPQPDEACRGRRWLGAPVGGVDRDRDAGPVYEPRMRLVGLLAARPTGARHDSTANCRRCPGRACGVRDRVHRPDVLNVYVPAAAVRGRAGRLRAPAAGVADRLDRAAGQDHRRVQRGGAPVRPRPAVPWVDFVKGQRKDDVMHEHLAGFTADRGGGVHRPGAGEDAAVPDREAPQRRGRVLPVDREDHRAGQPLLLLLRRRRLRPVLPQVLLLLPLQRQAVHQRQRVGQTAGGQGRDRVHRAGQRVRRRRRPGRAAGDLRPARTRPDRRAAAQMAGHPAAPVHRRRPGRRLPLRASRSCRPSSP